MARFEHENGHNGASRSSWKAFVAGATGAATLTLGHEVVRKLVPRGPRMHILGMDALSRGLRALGLSPPRGRRLRGYTLLADLASNAVYYAPVALSRKRPWLGGLALGAAAGLGAVLLAPKLGRPRRHRRLTLQTQAITVGLYAVSGLAAGLMASFLLRGEDAHESESESALPSPTPSPTPSPSPPDFDAGR